MLAIVLARNMVKTIKHPTCGPIKVVNTPFKFSDSEASIRTAPPTLGQHTDDLLAGLGYTAKCIEELKASGIVA